MHIGIRTSHLRCVQLHVDARQCRHDSRSKLEKPHSRSHRPLWQHIFPTMSVNYDLCLTLAFECDLNGAKTN